MKAPNRRSLSLDDQSLLIRFHFSSKRLQHLVDLKAPQVILNKEILCLALNAQSLYENNLMALYPIYEKALEAYRLKTKKESDIKFNCLEYAEFITKLSNKQAIKAKKICPYGGTYGSIDKCSNCPHFKRMSNEDCVRLKWV